MKTNLEILKEILIKYNVRQHLNINNFGYSIVEREIANTFVSKSTYRFFGVFCLIVGIVIGLIL